MRSFAASLLALVTVLPATAIAQDNLDSPRQVFSDEVSTGSWLRVRTMKGDIQVREGTGATAIVTASRKSGRGSTDGITFDVRRDGFGVTICAIYPHTRRCDEDGYQSSWRRSDGDLASVNFTVELPRGVKLLASTGNGDVNVRGAGDEVHASSGNGEVRVLGSGGRVRASTGNGSIELRLPASLSADIVANVSLRRFETEFPMQLPSRFSGRRIEGKIGEGGRRIRVSTGNGRVALLKNN